MPLWAERKNNNMKNLDLIKQENQAIIQRMQAAVKSEDTEAFAAAFGDFANAIQQQVFKDAQEMFGVTDAAVLAQRGVRQLTSEERKYYEALAGAMRSANPQQAVTGLDVVMPKTVIDSVFEDLVHEHPLLDAIEFVDAGAITEWLLNDQSKQLASWSPLSAEIVKELTAGFRKIDLSQNKLSAFLLVSKAMLDLGPEWLDRYVRAVLSESLYFGLEDGILNGKGQTANLHEPIGARKDLAGSVSPTTGYPDKTKVVFNSFDPVAYGELLASLAMTENGNYRVIPRAILVVNPVDYLKKIMPATTVRAADGTYRGDVFPFPTLVIQSAQIAANEAIIGIEKRYFMAAGVGKSGKIEFDDSYKFLQDERTYLTKFYGHGQPKDNTSFALLDITNLKPTIQQVTVENIDQFPVA